MQIPQYRVRVFLSVDLSGSTAYKARTKSSLWIRTFKKFYTDFLSIYRAKYVEYCESKDACTKFSENLPNLWKTVGDEAIFVNRIENAFHLYAYVHAFDQALQDYQRILKSNEMTSSLDVKGNGWLASFPYPNQTLSMADAANADFEDALPDETQEAGADSEPGKYEFLGPGIDSGFRISANSHPGFLTLSPALACVLGRANTNRDFVSYSFKLEYLGTTSHKGVINGDRYPIVGINTERNERKSALLRLQNGLDGNSQPTPTELMDYLENFIQYHDIEMPPLEINGAEMPIRTPQFYTEKFVQEWEALRHDLLAREKSLGESAKKQPTNEEPTLQNIDTLEGLVKALEAMTKLTTKP